MKFLVLKADDIVKYCDIEQRKQLLRICEEIEAGRIEDDKKPENRYVVVNMDEPYAHKVMELIEEHEGEKVSFE